MLFSITPVRVEANPIENNPAFRNIITGEPVIAFQIDGQARVWEATLHYRVKAGQQVLAQGFETASLGAPQWGTFSLNIHLTKQQAKGKELQLELFEENAEDGSEINKLIIPLKQLENQQAQNQAFRQITGSTHYLYPVEGETRVWEGTYQFEVSDGHDILVKGVGLASQGAPQWGTFQETIKISKDKVPINGSVILELYEQNMSDEGPPRLHSTFVRLDQFPW